MNKIFPIPHEFVTLSGQIESALLKTVDLSCFDDLIIREELKKIVELHLVNEDVNYDNMLKCLNDNGVVFVRLWQDIEHYVIITKIKSNS